MQLNYEALRTHLRAEITRYKREAAKSASLGFMNSFHKDIAKKEAIQTLYDFLERNVVKMEDESCNYRK